MPAPAGGIIGFSNENVIRIPVPQAQFLIEAFDREQWCPVLQAMFPVDDPEALRAVTAAGLAWIEAPRFRALRPLIVRR